MTIQRNGNPLITAPVNMPSEHILCFLQKHKKWLFNNILKSQERYRQNLSEEEHLYVEGELFYYLGQTYPLHFKTQNTPPCISIQTDGLYVCHRTPLQKVAIQRLIQTWYLKQFKEILARLVNQWLIRMNEAPISEIRLRKMTSRWGSCAPARRILCFNTKLIYKPLICIEEVVVHELCHLKESSHGPAFHALMALYLPDYKERNQILNGKQCRNQSR